MINARFLRHSTLEELRVHIEKNIDVYRHGKFSHIEADVTGWFEHPVLIDEAKLSNMLIPVGQNFYEPENCQNLYEALSAISPYEARDERFWAFLTHTVLLSYTRARWPIPTDDKSAVAHIQKHFFARDKRQIERDNAASRLWWMAHLCARVPNLSLTDALQAFLYRSDVRANIIERPTSSQSAEVFSAIVKSLSLSFATDKQLFERVIFRRFMRELNSIGGYKLLDCMSYQQIQGVVSGIVATVAEQTDFDPFT